LIHNELSQDFDDSLDASGGSGGFESSKDEAAAATTSNTRSEEIVAESQVGETEEEIVVDSNTRSGEKVVESGVETDVGKGKEGGVASTPTAEESGSEYVETVRSEEEGVHGDGDDTALVQESSSHAHHDDDDLRCAIVLLTQLLPDPHAALT
jgi:hypothetical protein